MTLTKDDFHFVEGFVKTAYELGASEEVTAALLLKAMSQRGADGLIKTAWNPARLFRAAKGTAGAVKPSGGALKWMGANKGKLALTGAGLGTAAVGGNMLYDRIRNGPANLKIPAGAFVPSSGIALNGASGGGASGSGGSSYAPAAANLQDNLAAEPFGGASTATSAAPTAATTPTSATTAAGRTQYEIKHAEEMAAINEHQRKLQAINARKSAIATSGANPIDSERQLASAEEQLSKESEALRARQAALNAMEPQYASKERGYDAARTEALNRMSGHLNHADENARLWAQRQKDVRDGNWLTSRAYKLRNWVTGDNEEYGNSMSQRIESLKALNKRLSSQPENYYR